ncbi:nucleotidyl transferase AbiEii/AbiGii toxin family protein [Cellulomonas algicola]|uniref:nucleotidyl transferase AbiEii/AbiGii toxin family protein n=1 Tax=Cellulomonas algicola TaxID=2071633 RepID=UPI001C3FF2F8|nr:nucleotidyl transferase AbiEii/AbiGii toxin family protein [Cellulomonas algicola]
MRPGQTYAALKREATARGRAFGEIVTLYALERFLARLTQTPYRDDFVLKGGVLLAAHGLRRPTRDIDAQLVDQTLDEVHLRAVVRAVAELPVDDALVLHVEDAWVEQIRDEDDYAGLRLHVPAHVHTFDVRTFTIDVSTGDPIRPRVDTVALPSILGDEPVTLRAHPLPTVVAEKTVTILQRGVTSTRWRDLMDVVSLARTTGSTQVSSPTPARRPRSIAESSRDL